MKLEIATFFVKDVRFSNETRYDGGVLEINKEELEQAFADIDING